MSNKLTNKLRVIQSNDNDVAVSLGDICWSANKANLNPAGTDQAAPVLTLFIFKRDGRVAASVFESVFSGRKDAEGNYVYNVVTQPVTADLTGTDLASVHLMASRELKDQVVDYVV